MIDFYKLSPQELDRCGFTFTNRANGRAFVGILRDAMEIRIGEAIHQASRGADPDPELLQGEDPESQAAMEEWLQKNCPGFRDVIARVQRDLEEELIAYRDKIPCLDRRVPETVRRIRVRELGLSLRSENCLLRAGLETVEQVAAYRDLTTIRNLSRTCAAEINRALLKLIAPRAWEKAPADQAEGKK